MFVYDEKASSGRYPVLCQVLLFDTRITCKIKGLNNL